MAGQHDADFGSVYHLAGKGRKQVFALLCAFGAKSFARLFVCMSCADLFSSANSATCQSCLNCPQHPVTRRTPVYPEKESRCIRDGFRAGRCKGQRDIEQKRLEERQGNDVGCISAQDRYFVWLRWLLPDSSP
jgi:hypothetical protein